MDINLILQTCSPDQGAIDRLADLAGGSQVENIAPGIFRIEHPAIFEAGSEAREAFDQACFAARADYAFTDGRRLSDFRLLVMDMDSTLITIECIDEIADMQGLKTQVAEITEAAMRGEIEFGESLIRRVALLKGLDHSALQRVYDTRLQLSPGAERMLDAVRAAGLKTLLVSGGFTFFTDRLQSRLALDVTHANVLEIQDGRLTGKVAGGIVDANAKRRAVERACERFGFKPSETIVMGDGANDLEMMRIAGLSVAFRAKPVVRRQADIALNFVGLDGILNILAN